MPSEKAAEVMSLSLGLALHAFMAGSTSGVLCYGGSVNRRVSVGTQPDLFFVAGVPDTQYLRPVKVNFDSDWPGSPGYSDCQAYARSNVAGVSIQQSYGIPGTVFRTGTWATIDQTSGPPPAGSGVSYSRVWGYPDQASGRIPVFYDGSGPPRSGTIDIAVNQATDIDFVPRMIAQVNVHVMATRGVSSAFVVTATAASVSGSDLRLDHPLLNGTPKTRVFVQHNGAGGRWNHPLGVWYDKSIGRWKIRNQDGAAMPAGQTFNVRIDPTAMTVHTALRGQQHYLILRHPDADGNPFATIIATPVTEGNRRMTQAFAVAYVEPHWQIVTGRPMPTSTRVNRLGFHVKVFGATHYVDDNRPGDPSGFLHTELSNGAGVDIVAASGRLFGGAKILSHWCWSGGSPVHPIIVTANWTPLPPPAPVSYTWVALNHIGTGVRGNFATVYYEDGSVMDGRVALNVWGPYRSTCP